jgi:hypothetical protein
MASPRHGLWVNSCPGVAPPGLFLCPEHDHSLEVEVLCPA